ncbi:MAG TPA: AAA family ATPase [Vicinamibacterales bacterium]|nr:AAA family ATPase [Vicinamibacterales bacterium]
MANQATGPAAVLEPLRVDAVNQCLWRGDVRIALKPKPFAVLRHLIAHADRLVTQNELLAAVWPDTYVHPEVIRQYILEIRRALGDRSGASRFIQTFPKRGYQFIAPVTDGGVAQVAESAPGAPVRLVGRASPMRVLAQALNSAQNGRRQIVFITGEAGIGKTSLVDAFQREAARAAGVRIARGHSVEGFGSKEAYYPVLDALGQLTRGTTGAVVASALATHAPTWFIQFPSLVKPEQRPAIQQEILGATRERMVRELCEALEALAPTATFVVSLEDLHWADHSTLDMISAIARRREPARLLVVGTFRPADAIVSDNPIKALKQDLIVHRLASEVILERLAESDVAEYLPAAFPGFDRSAGLAALIHRHSDGNPLFMTAMLDHLVQGGVIAQANGAWRITAPLEAIDPGAPDTLRQMLEMQLRQLTDDERSLLACASVAGHHFSVWSVATMLSREVMEVDEQCANLAERQQFIRVCGTRPLEDGDSTTELAFSHALYREVLYRHLSRRDRVLFHKRLADALERRGSVADEIAAEMALHCERAGDVQRAVRYLMLAAETATRRYAHREAIGMLEHARELAAKLHVDERPTIVVQILERIGAASVELGDMRHAIDSYEAAARCAAEAGLPIAESGALLRLAHPAAFVDTERAVVAAERAASIAASVGDSQLEARAKSLAAGWRLTDRWRMDDARAYASATAEFGRLGGDMSTYEHVMRSHIMFCQSEYAAAVESADRAWRTLTPANGLWERAPALSARAAALIHLGRLGEAQRTLANGLQLATKNDNTPWHHNFLAYVGWLRLLSHDFEGVREITIEMLRPGAARLAPQTHLRLFMFQGAVDVASGSCESALRLFQQAIDYPSQPKSFLSWYWRLLARMGRAEIYLAQGDVATASAEAEPLAQAVEPLADAYIKSLTHELRCRLALAAGQPERAEQRLARALDIVASVDVPLAAWRVHATASGVYRTTNRRKAAGHRSTAKTVIMRIADSFDDQTASLREVFLSSASVRRVIDI